MLFLYIRNPCHTTYTNPWLYLFKTTMKICQNTSKPFRNSMILMVKCTWVPYTCSKRAHSYRKRVFSSIKRPKTHDFDKEHPRNCCVFWFTMVNYKRLWLRSSIINMYLVVRRSIMLKNAIFCTKMAVTRDFNKEHPRNCCIFWFGTVNYIRLWFVCQLSTRT